jgi:long-chain fatty acid transport protein
MKNTSLRRLARLNKLDDPKPPTRRTMQYTLRTALIAGLLAPTLALATNGYFSHGYGIKAKGIGGVGIALPQDSLAAATNPAGIAFVGDRIDVGVDLFVPDRSVEITGNGAGRNGNYSGNGTKSFLIPEFGYNKTLNQTTSVGIAVYGNGGMNTKYNSSPFGGFWGGQDPAGVNLEQLFIAPTVAYKVSPRQSLGVSLVYAYQRFSADGLQGFAGSSSAPGNVSNQGTDTSTGWGVRIGWTGEISDSVTLGATYASRINASAFSKYKGLFADGGDFDIPENFGVGIAVKATPKLTLAADVQQINCGQIKAVANPLSNLLTGNLLGSANGPGFGWRDATVYKFGASYDYSKDLTLRAGFSTTRQPIPSSETFFNILAPGVIERNLTLGATCLAAEAQGPSSDPANPLFQRVGENILKSQLRSHPEVARRHYADLPQRSGAEGSTC